MRRLLCLAVLAGMCAPLLTVEAGVDYEDPDGGWSYLYTGEIGDDLETLDGTWDHENGSDAWDGSLIGDEDFAPGGVASITEGDVTFLRFQDAGDPRDLGFADPSNRKTYLTHDITEDDPDGEMLLTGVTLSFRTRLATDGLLDESPNAFPDGYYIRDGGKSTFSIRSPFSGPDGASAVISFAPATSSGDDEAENTSGALLMNNWDPAGGRDVDTLGNGDHRELALDDPSAWNEFWITIQEGEEFNEFKVDIYANGSTTPESFVVSSGNGNDGAFDSYIAMGVHSTPQTGAIDVDFFGFKPGIHVPTAGGLKGDFNGNGMLDAGDIDDLTLKSAGGMNPPVYDLNDDTQVNVDDVGVWVRDLFNSWIGDANLDQEFNSSDLVAVLSSGTYEVDVDAVWSTGDFNGDGRANSGDLVAALTDGGYEQGPKAAVAAVPEPSSLLLALLGVFGVASRRRHQRA